MLEPPAHATVVEAIAGRARDGATALRWLGSDGGGREEWTYAQLWTAASHAAFQLTAIARASPAPCSMRCCGVMIEEGPALYIVELACLIAGLVVVPVPVQDPPERLVALCTDAKFVVAVARTDAQRQQLQTASPSPFAVALATDILPGGPGGATDGATDGMAAGASASASASAVATVDPGSVSHVFFTSGSTGSPKGCAGTHRGLLSYCRAKNAAHCVTDSSVVFVASTHTFDPSFGDAMATWCAGATLAVSPAGAVLASFGACLVRPCPGATAPWPPTAP